MDAQFQQFMQKWTDKKLNPVSAFQLLQELRAISKFTLSVSGVRPFEQVYFRVRKGCVEDNTNPSEFSYPPAKIIFQGRCNLKGFPVFYGSESAEVAMDEVELEEGEDFYLSIWRSGDNFPKYDMYTWIETASAGRMHDDYKRRILGISDGTLTVLERFTTLFIAHTHTISAALSHHSLYVTGVDGIEYMDAKTRSCYNFALNPKFADKLILERVIRARKGPNNTFMNYATGDLNSGKVTWRQYQETDHPNYMNFERAYIGM